MYKDLDLNNLQWFMCHQIISKKTKLNLYTDIIHNIEKGRKKSAVVIINFSFVNMNEEHFEFFLTYKNIKNKEFRCSLKI